MFEAGAHYGYRKSKRHPTVSPYIYGQKNNVQIFDLEKTLEKLEEAKEFAKKIGARGKRLLFVTSKPEANQAIKTAAESVNQPYVIGRWIGGTLTNFKQIRKRVDRMQYLAQQREKGELEKYTKKEQLLFEREENKLEEKFGGIVDMDKLPGAMFIIDTEEESGALREAKARNVPVIGLCNIDCNLDKVEYPIPANDSNRKSITFFVNEIARAYEAGKKHAPQEEKQPTDKKRGDTKKS